MGIVEIPADEISFHSTSFCDRSGRVFWWKQELHRGIVAPRCTLYRRLFQEGVVQSLIEQDFLIETELTDLTLAGYDMVLKHRCIPFVSYPYEWCAEMLKAAALFVADLEIELARHHLTLAGADPWNLLFDGCRPVYVDFGSIAPVEANQDRLWTGYDSFCRFFIYPLQLMAQGHERIARWLLRDYEYAVLQSDFTVLMPQQSLGFRARPEIKQLQAIAQNRLPHRFRPMLKKGFTLLKSSLSKSAKEREQSRIDFVQQARDQVEAITTPSGWTEWREAYDSRYPVPTALDEWAQKQDIVHQVLAELHARSVLDIGSNGACYSQMAALLGSNVVALDVDDVRVTQCYRSARAKNLSILPLLMDIRYPSPGYGLGYEELAPATERLKCELVLALALVHLLVFRRYLTFEQISETLATFSKRWLIVEFISPQDQRVRGWWSEQIYSWYTLENFITALSKRFHRVKVCASHQDTHVLLLCEKQAKI